MKKLLVVFAVLVILSLNFTSLENTSNEISLDQTSSDYYPTPLSNKVYPGI